MSLVEPSSITLPKVSLRQFPDALDRRSGLGRKPSSAGKVSSNPRPHQKTMNPDLSRLVGLSLLLRQDQGLSSASG